MSIQKILVSQNAPRVLTQYQAVTEKFGAQFQFTPFFRIEPLTSREFRAQRINFLEYSAIVFLPVTSLTPFSPWRRNCG